MIKFDDQLDTPEKHCADTKRVELRMLAAPSLLRRHKSFSHSGGAQLILEEASELKGPRGLYCVFKLQNRFPEKLVNFDGTSNIGGQYEIV